MRQEIAITGMLKSHYDLVGLAAMLRTLLASTPYEIEVAEGEADSKGCDAPINLHLFQTGEQWEMRDDNVVLALTYAEAGVLTALIEQTQTSLLKAGNGAELVRRLAPIHSKLTELSTAIAATKDNSQGRA